ncbi:hypothetical protein [Wenxinia marina]|nr:hypothetical protein [Wenxinia marina]
MRRLPLFDPHQPLDRPRHPPQVRQGVARHPGDPANEVEMRLG